MQTGQRETEQTIKQITSTLAVGSYKVKCPLCQNERRKNRHDRPLSIQITTDNAVLYNCFHCGTKGSCWHSSKIVHTKHPVQATKGQYATDHYTKKKPAKIINSVGANTPQEQFESRQFLHGRKISDIVIKELGLLFSEHSFNGSGKISAVGFPYYNNDGEVYAIKYRAVDKKLFTQTKGGAKTLWNLPKLNGKSPSRIIICEGELDVCSFYQAGVKNNEYQTVVSVPNGAPPSTSKSSVPVQNDNKFRYIWNAEKYLENIEKIIIVSDNDEAGRALKAELSRRVGVHRCYEVDLKRKDVNEVLENDGEEAVRQLIENCTPMPVAGLNTIDHYHDAIMELYENGIKGGYSTGLENLDQYLQFYEGNLIVCTGLPASGKSSFCDFVAVQLAKQGLNGVFCSFEKPPKIHALQLAQILTGRPFYDIGTIEKMDQKQLESSLDWINDRFIFQDHLEGSPLTIDGILSTCATAVRRMVNCRYIIIDPFNYIDIQAGNGVSQTDAISQMLTKVSQFCKSRGLFCIYVCHPQKIYENRLVTPMDISGSFAWYAKPDTIFTIERVSEKVRVHIQKQRYSFFGKEGMAELFFDSLNGRYFEAEQEKTKNTDEWDTNF